jgi:hypothetical protein
LLLSFNFYSSFFKSFAIRLTNCAAWLQLASSTNKMNKKRREDLLHLQIVAAKNKDIYTKQVFTCQNILNISAVFGI